MYAPSPPETLARIALALERIADAITQQPADPAPDTPQPDSPAPDTPQPDSAWLTAREVAERYGVSPEVVRRRLLHGSDVYDEDGRLTVAESDLPPLPEGPLASPAEAEQITGMTNGQLRRRMHVGLLTGYQPFGISRYRYARAALLQYAAEEARRGR